MKKIIVSLTFVLGLYFVSSSGYMILKAELSQYLIKEAWQKTLVNKKDNRPWSWADTFPVLKLYVPRLSKSSYVLQGGSGRNMAFSVVHLDSSGLPGNQKSTVISGHNDSHFSYLKDLKIGDKIMTQDKINSHVFEVTLIEIINSNKHKIKIRNTNELILTTCYPFSELHFGGELRYVVYAKPVV